MLALRPQLLRWVESGTPTVVAVQRACGVTRSGPTRPVLHLLMTLGAALGNELFFITFMPFLFWEADASVARRVVLQWGVAYYVGQALKDVLMLPRPPAAVVLDNAGVESVLAAWRTPRNLRGGVEDEGEDDDAAAKRGKRRGAADAAAGAGTGICSFSQQSSAVYDGSEQRLGLR